MNSTALEAILKIQDQFGCTFAEADEIYAEDQAVEQAFRKSGAIKEFDIYCEDHNIDPCVAMENAGQQNDDSAAFWEGALNAAKFSFENE